MTINVTIKAGLSASLTRSVEAPITVSSLLTREVKSSLGVGENVTVVIDGRTVGLDHVVASSCTIRLETAAASKAA